MTHPMPGCRGWPRPPPRWRASAPPGRPPGRSSGGASRRRARPGSGPYGEYASLLPDAIGGSPAGGGMDVGPVRAVPAYNSGVMVNGQTTAILRWYASHARDLPWRRPDASPWAILVSEIMLQQTPVARVLPAYEAWLARWPTPSSLAAASPADAVRQWGRLGYPRRALRLHAAARAITEEHGGAVPSSVAALRALPGVGSYTAAAVASFAYG